MSIGVLFFGVSQQPEEISYCTYKRGYELVRPQPLKRENLRSAFNWPISCRRELSPCKSPGFSSCPLASCYRLSVTVGSLTAWGWGIGGRVAKEAGRKPLASTALRRFELEMAISDTPARTYVLERVCGVCVAKGRFSWTIVELAGSMLLHGDTRIPTPFV